MFKKVLVCGPTASAKNYCFNDWIDNVLNFTYPNFDVRLFDNTNDKGNNATKLNKYVSDNYGDVGLDKKFFCQNSLIINNSNEKDVIPKMAISHNDCRNYLLTNDYDFMLHLETDVFPQKNIIETLMFNCKPIVGGIYYIDEGKYRALMIQRFIEIGPKRGISINFKPEEELNFLDGTLKKVSHIGLGCVLIHRDIFKKIKFRYAGVGMHPDTFFAEDCQSLGYKIFADTSCISEHRNKSW
jgi:hypothetical protein